MARQEAEVEAIALELHLKRGGFCPIIRVNFVDTVFKIRPQDLRTMASLPALNCPKCGARLELLEGEKATICLYCGMPVLIRWDPGEEPTATCGTVELEPGCIEEIVRSLNARVETYRQEWIQLENEFRSIWEEYKRQKRRVLSLGLEAGPTPYYLSAPQRKELEPHLAELKSKLIPRDNRSNHLAEKIDLSLKNCRALKAGRISPTLAGWPRMFSNILEVEPSGVSYLERFEPLFYELTRRNLLAPELGRVDHFVPVQMLVAAMPVGFTRNLEFGQAAEINHLLMLAGAVGRIASTDLTRHLLTEIKAPAWEEVGERVGG